LGQRLKNDDLNRLSSGLVVLNCIALSFGAAEYFGDLHTFFPESAVTAIMYSSRDVANFQHYRIPATFSSAHAYAGSMVFTLPFLIGAWVQPTFSYPRRLFLLCGIGAAALGILMASARTHVVLAGIVALTALFQGRMKTSARIILGGVLVAVMAAAASNERFQRVMSLGDTEAVASRLQGSVNRTFLEILVEYPMGNGLGGGGTSLPTFVTGMVKSPVAMESEYARILLEQGVIGLLLWIGFITWFLVQRGAKETDPWQTGRMLGWYACAASLGVATIGTGMLTSIPQTVLMMLTMGWATARPTDAHPEPPTPAFQHDDSVAYVG
jgi:hypothetical protein